MNAKRKGTRNEHRTILALEAQGYKCSRAAGSLGAWDVMAFGRQRVLLVQVKTNRPAPRKEMEALRQFEIPNCCVSKQLWIWKDRQAVPVVIPIPCEGGDRTVIGQEN